VYPVIGLANGLVQVADGEAKIVDGPFDPGTGEDWFEVYSASTGTGWALAEYLYPN
jgi:hypothetical protein